jgi:hypothetical protein
MSVPMLNRQLLLEDPVRIPDGAGDLRSLGSRLARFGPR